jgi:thioredoxin-dependent peroxiredoxin
MLKVGDQVPEFAFSSEAFGSVSAASLRGKRYVMYFYPKDDTPGCTREACAFRDNLPKFGGIGIKVFGISADDEKSHLRFARKHSLNFKLIPDPDHQICEAFGTWIEKSMYGRSYMGVARSTFIIAPDGKIEKVWEKVAPDGHAEEVFAWLNGDPIPVPVKPVPAAKPATLAKPVAVAAVKPEVAAVAKPQQPVPVAAAKVTKPLKTSSVKPAAPVARTAAAKPAVKPAPAKKAAAKSAAKRPAAKPAAAKKQVAAKPAARKAAVKKPAAKKAVKAKPGKTAVAKKTAAKKVVAKKVPVKKPAAKKAAVKKKR